jgi:hypothetical protein
MQQALDANDAALKAAVEANAQALKAPLESHDSEIKQQLVIQQQRADEQAPCELSTIRPGCLPASQASSAPSWRTSSCRSSTLPLVPLPRSPRLS